MRLTIIITTYNWPEALILVLKSVENQPMAPDEVIIADDGSTVETREVVSRFQQHSELNIVHSWQQDKGFRIAKSRNKAIVKSKGEYIILIDGDIILHPNFIQDHINHSQENYFIQGTRVLLTQDKTQQIFGTKEISFSFFSSGINNRKNAIHSNLLSKFFSATKNGIHGIKSCNMSFYKKDCINVNGFNNQIEGWGREDSEFIVRLINSGIHRKNIRFNAIQFHLWHNDHVRDSLDQNNLILNEALNKHMQWCDDGINRYL